MTTLQLLATTYYQHKDDFVALYQDIGLTWLENITLNSQVVSGWFSECHEVYLIKLPAPNGFKHFTGNCVTLFDFLRGIGAIDIKTTPSTKHPIVNDYHFIGADLDSHYRLERKLKNLPNNLNIIWK